MDDKKIKRLKNEINNILNEWDPIHVVEDGVFDEYSSYAGEILSILINNDANSKKLHEYIDYIVKGMGFNPIQEESKRISKAILEWWEKQK